MSSATQQRPPPFVPNWPARLAWLALAIYAVYAASILDITWERFVAGLENGVKFIGRMLPPDTEADKMKLMLKAMAVGANDPAAKRLYELMFGA